MATTGQNFILNNNAATLNNAAFTAIPFVDGFEPQSAQSMTGRNRGGAAYLGLPWIVSAKNIIMLDAVISACDSDGLAKHGVFHVTTSGTTPVTISLLNLVTNATTQYGDAVFATWNKLIAFNLSGLDGVAAADMTIERPAAPIRPASSSAARPRPSRWRHRPRAS